VVKVDAAAVRGPRRSAWDVAGVGPQLHPMGGGPTRPAATDGVVWRAWMAASVTMQKTAGHDLQRLFTPGPSHDPARRCPVEPVGRNGQATGLRPKKMIGQVRSPARQVIGRGR